MKLSFNGYSRCTKKYFGWRSWCDAPHKRVFIPNSLKTFCASVIIFNRRIFFKMEWTLIKKVSPYCDKWWSDAPNCFSFGKVWNGLDIITDYSFLLLRKTNILLHLILPSISGKQCQIMLCTSETSPLNDSTRRKQNTQKRKKQAPLERACTVNGIDFLPRSQYLVEPAVKGDHSCAYIHRCQVLKRERYSVF